MNGEDKVKLDAIDRQILQILQEDGRITNTKLAKSVGLSAPPILERVKKLERAGVIKCYRAILDAKALGRAFVVFAAVNLDVKALADVAVFETSVRRMPEVLECHHIAGDIDFLLKINVADQEHYKQLVIEGLSKIEGINRMQSWVVLSTCKESTTLPITTSHHAAQKP